MWRHLMTSKHFRYGLLFTSIGALGLAIFGVFRIAAFSYYGPLTLPYTTPIDDLSAIFFFGSLPVSESIALYQWLRSDIKPKEKQEPQIIPVQETTPAIATLAEATIAPAVAVPLVAAPVAIPATTDLVFMDEEGILKLGDKMVELPAMKNEHLLCRAMFKYPVGKMVDWTIPYEEMTGEELNKVSYPDEYWKAWHSLYDTTKALNNRVNEQLGIERLVKWKDNTLQRTR
jgi:hypothetical protein